MEPIKNVKNQLLKDALEALITDQTDELKDSVQPSPDCNPQSDSE